MPATRTQQLARARRSQPQPFANYPGTVSEILDPAARYHPDVLRAVRAFRTAKPWRGTPAERFAKFETLHQALCRVYSLRTQLRHVPGSADYYAPADRTITLGSLSVVTYLHEFAHAAFGSDERKACRWSVNLFRRLFPKSFARCRHVGHLLVRAA